MSTEDGPQPTRSGHGGSVEHLVLTTVVKDADWKGRTSAVLTAVRATLAQRACQRGLALQGEPEEDVEVLITDHRVRITMTADAVPAPHDLPDDLPHGRPLP